MFTDFAATQQMHIQYDMKIGFKFKSDVPVNIYYTCVCFMVFFIVPGNMNMEHFCIFMYLYTTLL